MRPPVHSFGGGRAQVSVDEAGTGSSVPSGVQLMVAETRSTTPQRVRDVVAAFSWAAREMASEGEGPF